MGIVTGLRIQDSCVRAYLEGTHGAVRHPRVAVDHVRVLPLGIFFGHKWSRVSRRLVKVQELLVKVQGLLLKVQVPEGIMSTIN